MENKKEVSALTWLKEHIRGKTYFVFMCVLFFCSIVSLICEIFFSRSIIATIAPLIVKCAFVQKHFAWVVPLFYKNLPKILHASVVLEIVKILGFGSILIGVVQTLMDKETFGVSYANIVKHFYPYYRETFVIHLLVTVMCIGFSAAGASEGALLTFVVMLLGFLYQWIIIDDLIFHTANREFVAVQILSASILDPGNGDILSVVQSIAREASKEGNLENSAFLKCFSEAILKCCSNKSNDNSSSIYKATIRDTSSIWETTLVHKSESEQLRFAACIVAECCKIDNSEMSSVVVLTSGLVLFLYNQLNSSLCNEQSSNYEGFFTKLSNLVYLLNSALSKHLDSKSESETPINDNIAMVQRYLRTFYTVLIWIKVKDHILRVTTDVLALKVDPNLSVFYPILSETICSTMALTTQEEYDQKKNKIDCVSNKLGLLPKGDAVNAS